MVLPFDRLLPVLFLVTSADICPREILSTAPLLKAERRHGTHVTYGTLSVVKFSFSAGDVRAQTVQRLVLDICCNAVRLPAGPRGVIFSKAPRQVVGPLQPGGGTCPWCSAWGVNLTSRFQLLPRLRMNGALPPFLQTPSWPAY